MVEIKRVHIIGTCKVCFIDVTKKIILFETELEYGKPNLASIYEQGISYGLSAFGENFFYGYEKLTQEAVDNLIKT
jgi:hypothetical protein